MGKAENQYIIFFGYYGAKNKHTYLKNTLPLIPDHKIYGEPYAGSLGVLLNKARAEEEYVSDGDEDIAFLHSVMADKEKGAILTERLKKIDVDKEEFEKIKHLAFMGYPNMDDVERAVCVFKTLKFSYNSCREYFRGVDKEVYQNWINKNIDRVHERMQGVHVAHENSMDVIERFKQNEDCFLFLDPPYCSWLRSEGADDVYTVEADLEDQLMLLNSVTTSDVKAKIMICGYYSGDGENDYYDSVLLKNGWIRVKIAELTKTAANVREDGTKPKGTEYVWINYEPENNILDNYTSVKWEDLFDYDTKFS